MKKEWKKELGITHVLVTVKCLLIFPNAESALNEEAGRLLLEDYDAYCQHAKLITSIHSLSFGQRDTKSTNENAHCSAKAAEEATKAKVEMPKKAKRRL